MPDFTALAFCLFIFLLSAADARAHPGWGIQVDRQGQIYFGDVARNVIWKITADGRLAALASNKHSHSLCLDQSGNLYGEHVYYDWASNVWVASVWKLAPDGALTDIFPQTIRPVAGAGVFMDREGNVYSVRGGAASSGRVELLKLSPDGQLTVVAGGGRGHRDGKGSEAEFTYIIGMAEGPDGSLYVTDRSSVRRVTRDGVVTTIGDDPLGGVERSENPRMLGVAVDEDENVYVADYDYRCVRRITKDGSTSTLIESGLFWSPTGVAVLGDEVYILEHYPESFPGVAMAFVGPYARVRKLSPDGRVVTIATLWGWTETTMIGAGVAFATLVLFTWLIRRRLKRRMK